MKSAVYKIAAICAFLSAITTIGIHSVFKSPGSFEESLVLYKTGYYILSKWWTIFHCVFVIVSIYGLAIYLAKPGKTFGILGFTFYTAFGLTEILRMFLVLHYLSLLRDQYLATNDQLLRDVIKLSIDNFNGIGNALFASFSLFIILGNTFIGIACLRHEKYVRYLGSMLLLWVGVLIVSLTNEYLRSAVIDQFIGYFSLFFQPVIRVLIGIVLLRLSRVTSHMGPQSAG